MPDFTNRDKKKYAPITRIRSAETLGQLFRAERKRQGLTLESLYALTGLSIRFLSEFERGKPNASLSRVLHALQALGLETLILPRNEAEKLLARSAQPNDNNPPT